MNNTNKTLGQIFYEAYFPNDGSRMWSECSTRERWEVGAAAVIAHYEASKQPQPWTLPSPPPGRSWHRDDWTAEMLPDGWRPLLKGEVLQEGDQIMGCFGWEWAYRLIGYVASRMRTRRPLPPTHEVKITLPPLKLQTGKWSIASV